MPNDPFENIDQPIKNAKCFIVPRGDIKRSPSNLNCIGESWFYPYPAGIFKFLNLSDGLVWDGMELFSCTAHERAGTVFNHPTLVDYHAKYAKGLFFAKRLVLGRGTEFLVCYDSASHCYELVDRDSLKPMLKLPRFEDILFHVINT